MKTATLVLSLWGRLTLFAELCARLWAQYWMLLVGSLLVLGSVALKWVQFPFSHNLSGLKLSLIHDPGVTPHLSLFSVGALGVINLAAGLAFLRKSPALLGLAASVIIMLWALTPAQIAFRQPSMLRRLTYELQVMPLQNVFAKQYLLQNYGLPELVPKRPFLYSAWGRFIAAWSFLRLGWYCFGLGGLLLAGCAVVRMPGRRLTHALLLLSLPIGALLVVLIPPAIGQHYFVDGAQASIRGRNQEAIAAYRKAMRWDGWHANDVDLYATIGELQKQAGVAFDSPERHIKQAIELRGDNEFEAALFEFGRASEAGGALSDTARREIAATRMAFGLALYQVGGISSAVATWELALREDPSLIYVLPFVAKGYYDLGRYDSGIAAVQQLVKLIQDHKSALANAYSTAADCYAKLGQDAQARKYYSLSLTADPILNYWALTGMVGE
jgi:tetratricopeptide (TPR) repeat protein